MCDSDARPARQCHSPLSEKCFRRKETFCPAAFMHISNLRVEMQQKGLRYCTKEFGLAELKEVRHR